MEFLLGSLITIAIFAWLAKLNRSNANMYPPRFKLFFSQSRKFLLAPGYYQRFSHFSTAMKTQATDYVDRVGTRIFVVNGQAYWIKDQTLYVTEFNGNTPIDESRGKAVDTMAMDDVELKHIIYVIDKLTEGKPNDFGSAGN